MSPATQVFLSYRRLDANPVIGRIYDRLVQAYGKDSVFKDVDTLPIGQDFREHIHKHVEQCQALMAVIGPQWLSITYTDGNRRLDNPDDWVRIEIAAALKRKIPVVPLLVMDAKMPKAAELPDDLQDLAPRNGLAIRADPDFHNDMERLIGKLNLPMIAAAPDQPSMSSPDLGLQIPQVFSLTPIQRKKFREALLASFPSLGDFTLMFDDVFKPLNQCVNTSDSYPIVVQSSIRWAESGGKQVELLQAALAAQPSSPSLQAILSDWTHL